MAVSSNHEIIGRPAMSCITLGLSDFMRVPLPAAKITIARGGFSCSIVIFFLDTSEINKSHGISIRYIAPDYLLAKTSFLSPA